MLNHIRFIIKNKQLFKKLLFGYGDIFFNILISFCKIHVILYILNAS